MRALGLAFLFFLVTTQAHATPNSLDIADDEIVYLFPSYALCEDLTCRINIHGWVFEPELSSVWRVPLHWTIRSLLGRQLSRREEGIFRERVTWFTVDSERGKHVNFDRPPGRSPKTGPDGHFRLRLDLPRKAENVRAGQEVLIETAPTSDGRVFHGRSFLIPPDGISVISDIDDTIKHTNVLDKSEMLNNTLTKPFVDIPGTARLYRSLAAHGAAFHYVSSSPWYLAEPLRAFMTRSGFPLGSFHLRTFRFTDRSLLNLFASSAQTKPPAIKAILADFPKRRFIFIGDSGEADPEIYRSLLDEHRSQIVFVLIRNVRGTAQENERLRRTFAGVSPERWALFDEKTDLQKIETKLLQAASLTTPESTPQDGAHE
jgi:hypothetical protein